MCGQSVLALLKTFVFLSLTAGWSAWAAGNAERGVVSLESAMVYSKPDFDSSVVSYLGKGAKVVLSKKAYGAFRRVVLKGGKTGYISEADVVTASKQRRAPASEAKKKPKRLKPVAETRYVGALLGWIDYREAFGSKEVVSQEMIYGLKVTGPDLVSFGPYLMDLNLALHLGAPRHYREGADIPPSGFFLIGDALMMIPFRERMNSTLYFALGPVLNYSQFNVIYQKTVLNLKELRFGGVGALGAGVRMWSSIVRVEYKYYWDRVKYGAFQLGVQGEF